MTPAETRQIFGDSFDGKYFNGNDYVSVTFRYNGNTSVDSTDWIDPDGYFVSGRDVLIYSANASGVSNNSSYVTVDVTPQYSLFDFDTLYCNIGVTNAYSQNVSAYQTPFWNWFIDGQNVRFEGTSTIPSSGQFPQVTLRNNNTRKYIFCPVKYTNQSTVSGYSLRAGFYGASTYSSTLTIYISCPYITDGASGETGIFTTTTGSNQGNVDITVDVDMTETNTLLGGIADLIGGLVDGVAGIFIPEEGVLESFENDLADLLLDTFGGVENDMLFSVIEDLLTHGATQSVTFPAIDVPNTNFHLPAYSVPLKPNAVGLHAFYDAIALAIDLVATCAVLNLIQENIKAFLVGEKVVDIQNVD